MEYYLQFGGVSFGRKSHTHTHCISSEVHELLKFMKHLGCPGLTYGFEYI